MKIKIAIRASDDKEENKEIIKILENLGGNNFDSLRGNASNVGFYYINDDNKISCGHIESLIIKNKELILYTLEEYKKEFMENREIKITPPEGYEIDKENSTFEKIIFKKVEEKLTYEKIASKLFQDKKHYYIASDGRIVETILQAWLCPNTAPTEKQLQRLLAINKLMNVAYYLNDGWEPDWNDTNTLKYGLYYDHNLKKIIIDFNFNHQKAIVYFKTRELAQQAIEILGEETIKLALGV